MKKRNNRSSDGQKLEGEGSYKATRSYDQHLKNFVDSADTEKLADDARRALDGKEGAELRQAERIGKSGHPKQANRAPSKPGGR